MSKEDGIAFGLAGVLAWGAATAYYLAFGPALLESAFWFYALNAFMAAAATAFLFHAAARLRRKPQRARPLAAALFAAPGFALGGVMVINLTSIFPDMAPATIGRYAAFMLVGYATVAVTAFERRPRPAVSHAQ